MNAIDASNERIAEFLLLRCDADPLLRNKRGRKAVDVVSRSSVLYQLLQEKPSSTQTQEGAAPTCAPTTAGEL